MATVDKNFRIKNGLAVEGNIATVNGENILREGSGDSYIINLIGGTATSDNVASTVVKRDQNGNFSTGQISLNTLQVQNAGSIYEDSAFIIESNSNYPILIDGNQDVTISSRNGDINFNPDGNVFIGSKNNDNQVATHGYVDNAASNAYSNAVSDAQTFANNAYNNATDYADGILTQANGYTDSAVGTEVGNRNSAISDAISTEVTNRNNAISDAIDTEVTDRNNAIDSAITNLNLPGTYDALGAASQALTDANSYTDGKVADLVDSAPALLDTLNELAAAIADNPNYATDVANLVATKADTTYVDSEISDLNTAAQGYASTAQSAAESFATTAANNAQSNAEDYADTVASNAQSAAQSYADTAATGARSDANTYTDNSINSVLDGTSQFTEVSIGWMSREVAAYSYESGTNQVTAYAWDRWKGSSAKFLVRVRNGVHSQVSEILITRDDSNNIAITEYAIVTTNGILADITADYNVVTSQIQLKVTPAHTGGTEIIVAGTLMSYGD